MKHVNRTAMKTIVKLTEATVEIGQHMTQVIDGLTSSGVLYAEGVKEFKKRFITRVIDRNHGNQSRAARELGMHRNTLARTVAELGIDVADLHPKHKAIGVQKLVEITDLARKA